MNAKEMAAYVIGKPFGTIINFSFNKDLDGKFGCGIHNLYDAEVFTIGGWGGHGIFLVETDGSIGLKTAIFIEETIQNFMNYHGQHQMFLDVEAPSEYNIYVSYEDTNEMDEECKNDNDEEDMLFRIEKLGWTVVEENDEFVKLGNISPMGQSFEIIVKKDDEDNDDESFIQNLLFVHNNFFSEDVAHIFIESPEDDNTECYPSSTRSAMELMNSMAACREMINNLCTDLIHSKKGE